MEVLYKMPTMPRNERGEGSSPACPSEDALSGFVSRALDAESMGRIAGHVARCVECREDVRALAEWTACNPGLGDAESRSVARKAMKGLGLRQFQGPWRGLLQALAPRCEHLAAADGQSADQLQQDAAIRSGFMHFASKTPSGHADAWHAKLALPVAVTADTRLRIYVLDAKGEPVDSGTLKFCGVDLEVSKGYAVIPIGEFRDNINVPMIALQRPDGDAVPGEPVLAFEASRG